MIFKKIKKKRKAGGGRKKDPNKKVFGTIQLEKKTILELKELKKDKSYNDLIIELLFKNRQ